MPSKGLVTVTRNGQVEMKIIAGSNGHKAVALANCIRRQRTLPYPAQVGYNVAALHGFGSEDSLVVMDRMRIDFRGGVELSPLCRSTFDQPEFNPLSEDGAADFVEIVEL
jgi:hypothetical protein